MPRVKGGYTTRRRRKAILKLAKGYFGSKRTLYKTANEQVMRSLSYAYRDRKQRKREFRKLWITRINAACAINGVKYSRFVHGLKLAGVEVNRKMLAELAIFDEKGFADLVEVSKKGKTAKVAAPKATPKVEVKETAPKAEVKATPKAEVKETAPKAEVKATPKAEVKEAAPKAEASAAASNLNDLKVTDLREMAKAKGITGTSTMKKADLIELLSK